MASSMMGTVFELSCINRLSGIGGRIGKNINPCGTIIDCDPVEWDLMFNSYPDWNLDPTCTIPGLCGGDWPPSSANQGGTTTGGATTGGTSAFGGFNQPFGGIGGGSSTGSFGVGGF